MMETKANDAAFSDATDHYGNPTLGFGLTKREYFAAIALQGLLTNSYNNTLTKDAIARIAIVHADALIAALSKE